MRKGWTYAEVKRCFELIATGLTTSVIAETLNTEFHRGFEVRSNAKVRSVVNVGQRPGGHWHHVWQQVAPPPLPLTAIETPRPAPPVTAKTTTVLLENATGTMSVETRRPIAEIVAFLMGAEAA